MRKITSTFVATWATLLFGCAVDVDTDLEDVATREQGFVNSDNVGEVVAEQLGLAAVYHRREVPNDAEWFGRPCSGVIVKSNGQSTYILTARHCVTVDYEVTGPVQSSGIASRFAVKPGANPGVAHPTFAPSGSVPITGLYATVVQNTLAVDMAIVRVAFDWSERVSNRPILMSEVNQIPDGVELFSYGYGISVYDTNCGSNESAAGAGIARFASGFLVSDQVNLPPHGPYRGGEFSFVNWGANGERMICGDSGGPDYINWPVVSGLADTHLAGVHSGITWETPGNPGTGTSAFSGAWISQVVDGLYVYPASTGWNMKYGSNYTLTLGGTASPHFIYSNTYQRIYVDYDDYTMCLQKKSSNSQAELALCSGSAAQKWEVTSANRIRNPTNNTCLTENGSQVVVNTCVSSTASLSARKKQTWMFAGRPYDVEG